jgi:hypothetical protein
MRQKKGSGSKTETVNFDLLVNIKFKKLGKNNLAAFNVRGLSSMNLNPDGCMKIICSKVVVWNLRTTSPFACRQGETCVAMAGNLEYI